MLESPKRDSVINVTLFFFFSFFWQGNDGSDRGKEQGIGSAQGQHHKLIMMIHSGTWTFISSHSHLGASSYYSKVVYRSRAWKCRSTMFAGMSIAQMEAMRDALNAEVLVSSATVANAALNWWNVC